MSQQSDLGALATEDPTPYQRFGGDAAARALIDCFYDLIDRWLARLTRAMSERRVEPELARELLQSLALTADWMRNRFG
jgi:truncated hemoglobin YjbI